MPVLEDALERSISLAAAMDARGYGRTSGASDVARRTTGALLLLGLAGVAIGLYGLLDATAPLPAPMPILLVGVALLVTGLAISGRRARRTRYRPDPWGPPEWLLAAAGGVAVVLTSIGAVVDPTSLHPSLVPLEWPALAGLPTLGLLIAALPAWLTPSLRSSYGALVHRRSADPIPGTVRS